MLNRPLLHAYRCATIAGLVIIIIIINIFIIMNIIIIITILILYMIITNYHNITIIFPLLPPLQFFPCVTFPSQSYLLVFSVTTIKLVIL